MNHPGLVLPYHEKLFPEGQIPSWLTQSFFWLSIFIADFFLAGTNTLVELGIISFYLAIGLTLSFSARSLHAFLPDLLLFLKEPNQNPESWYQNQLTTVFKGWKPLACGVALMLAVEVTVGQTINALQAHNPGLMYFRMGYRIVGFALLGMSVWSLFRVMRLPAQIIAISGSTQLTHKASLGLQSLGALFFKLALAVVCCFTVLVATILFSPLSGNILVTVWVVLGSLLIFCFFLLPQIGIHRIMAREKRQQLIAFAAHLDEVQAQSIFDPSTENTQKLKELFEVQKHLKEMNDWPFNTQMLWQLISALLIPLMLAVLQLFLEVRI